MTEPKKHTRTITVEIEVCKRCGKEMAFQRLWDTLSDILEETGTDIPKGLRQAALDAIEQAKEEKPDEA